MRLVTAAGVAAAIVAAGCGDDGGGRGGARAGGGPLGGGGRGGGARGATDFLDPASYDCRAAGQLPIPGPRPADLACLFDVTCGSRFVCAHRMGNPFGPENSLSALRASILLGVDIVETDVRLTADGHVVLIHDADVDRVFEGSGDVSSFTLAELEAMPRKVEAGDPPGDFSCERVVTLEQVMALARGRVVVELETKETAAGVAVAQYLSAEALDRDAYIQCTPSECDAIRAAVPDAPLMVRVKSLEDLALAEAYDPPPHLVEIDPGPPFTDPDVLARIHALEALAFTNAFFGADAVALITGDLSQYAAGYEGGVDVQQTEFPHLALYALGRISTLASP